MLLNAAPVKPPNFKHGHTRSNSSSAELQFLSLDFRDAAVAWL